MPELLLTDIELRAADMLIYHFSQTPLICPPSRFKAELVFSREALPKLLTDLLTLQHALRVLRAANAEGTCPICPNAKAWESGELRLIREMLDKEAT